ncbi:MAG TPA: KpsF/GutQ family sugar-phosphate isomerase [Terriglobales bacterium]|jgi:arabinose-5-phosphate isomerase|nr:KpsF/GutQ family sugar-phosphate isomerase [Terriglobales bacterium]
MSSTGENVVRIEAEALVALAERLAGPMKESFERAVDLLHRCTARVVVTGMGKSGIIAQKIAATLSSTGTPSLFMHPAEALHGDLGMVATGDVVIALSSSGETEELLKLLAKIKRIGDALICFTCDLQSTLAQASDVVLDCSVPREGCNLGLAPTASTTTMLALGDAVAVALAEKRGFKEEDFAELHPGGKLGKQLMRVSELMHAGDALPRVAPDTSMHEVIYEMSRKKLGMTTVAQNGKLLGVISDGDLRRLLEHRGKDAMDLKAGECMTRTPVTVPASTFAMTALNLMEERKITSLVITAEDSRLLGVLHLHDLWGTESI